MRKRQTARLLCGAVCAALLCGCTQAGMLAPAAPLPPAQTAVAAQLNESGAALPAGRLTLFTFTAAGKNEAVVLAGDHLLYRAAAGKTVHLLADAAKGAASCYAVSQGTEDTGAAVYDAAGGEIYFCAANEVPLLTAGSWLLVGTPENGVCTAARWLRMGTGEEKAGPAGIAARAQNVRAGAAPGGGFWLDTADGGVLFFDADAEQTAAAAGQKLVGFLGGMACLQAEGADALTTLDPATGAAGPALTSGRTLYSAGWEGYQILAGEDGSTVYDADGKIVAAFSGWCRFYNGHIAILSRTAPVQTQAGEVRTASGTLTLVLPDGTGVPASAASWNTRTGAAALAQGAGVTVYGRGGRVLYSVKKIAAKTRFYLLADGTLAVEKTDRSGVALYSHRGKMYASSEYVAFAPAAASTTPVAYRADGRCALLLDGGATTVGELDACRPLSDTRAVVRQGAMVGLIDAGGRWVWSLDTSA